MELFWRSLSQTGPADPTSHIPAHALRPGNSALRHRCCRDYLPDLPFALARHLPPPLLFTPALHTSA
eukprot:4147476-Prymnesium_polylepis.1